VRWIGHSGLAAGRPGGTPTRHTLATAERLHIDWLELDVWRTADGYLVLRHDLLLPSQRRVDALPLSGIRNEDADVLTLDEAVEVLGQDGIPVLVDLKQPSDARAIADWLATRPDPDRWAVCSDDVTALQGMREHAPKVARWRTLPHVPAGRGESVRRIKASALRSLLPARLPSLASEVGAAGLSVDRWAVTPGLTAAARRVGLPVAAWTVNTRTAAQRMSACAVDYITTDKPQEMRAVLTSQDSGATARCDG
jgi:glycerophosphoryl diester phosphodiesterase